MENFSYVQEGGRNFLKLESRGEEDYIVGMFAHNDIPAFVPARFKSLNLETYICYNMNGLIPISQSFEMNKLNFNRLEAFLRSIITIAKSMEEFLLPFDRLITDEAYIYESYDKKNEFYWIYGSSEGNCRFTNLFECLLDRVDYKDDRAVKMIYSLYQSAKDSEDIEGVNGRGSGFYRVVEKAGELLSAPYTSLDLRAKELIRLENDRAGGNFYMGRSKGDNSQIGRGGKACHQDERYNFYRKQDFVEGYKEMSDRETIEADTMARRYREETKNKIAKIQREEKADNIKSKISLFNKKSSVEKSDKIPAVKSKLKKVWDYLNSDIGSKPESLVEREVLEEAEISYNVREVRPPKPNLRENVSEATTLLTGALVRNGIYCLKPEDSNEDNILLTEFPFFIGKSEENTHYKIEDSTVSRFHARIDREEEELWLTDLNSTNGTFLNGIRLVPFGRMKVNKGDSIVISRKRYEFKYLV